MVGYLSTEYMYLQIPLKVNITLNIIVIRRKIKIAMPKTGYSR